MFILVLEKRGCNAHARIARSPVAIDSRTLCSLNLYSRYHYVPELICYIAPITRPAVSCSGSPTFRSMSSKCPHCGTPTSQTTDHSPPTPPPAPFQGSKVQTPEDIYNLIASANKATERLRIAYRAQQRRLAQTSGRPPSSLCKQNRVSFHPLTKALSK